MNSLGRVALGKTRAMWHHRFHTPPSSDFSRLGASYFYCLGRLEDAESFGIRFSFNKIPGITIVCDGRKSDLEERLRSIVTLESCCG
jgi:hypothetical protein